MIVVVGLPRLTRSEPPVASGLAVSIARASAGAGAAVQLLGKVGDDPEGDLVLLDLSATGVAHVAMLRDPARRTAVEGAGAEPGAAPTLEPADLELGLRYIPEYRVLVLAAPELPALLPVAAAAAEYAAAHLIAIVARGTPLGALPEASTVVRAGAQSGDSALGSLVASYAVALDAGEESGLAWRRARAAVGLTSPIPAQP